MLAKPGGDGAGGAKKGRSRGDAMFTKNARRILETICECSFPDQEQHRALSLSLAHFPPQWG